MVCLNSNLWALTTGACADLANFGCISTGVLIHIGYAVISVWVDGRPGHQGTGQYKVNIFRDLISYKVCKRRKDLNSTEVTFKNLIPDINSRIAGQERTSK